MKAFIDSPLLIYLNTMTEPHTRALMENFYIDVLTRYKTFTDVLVLDELIFVSKKKYGIPYKESIEFIETTILPFITILGIGEEEYSEAKKYMLKYNLKSSSSLHLGVMLKNNIRTIISEDKEFDKIQNIRREWIGKH